MNVIITGGGTGGHIYPALSVAKRLIELGHNVEFIGSQKGLEKDIFDAECEKHFITITGLNRSVSLESAKQNLKLMSVVRKAKKDSSQIIDNMNADVVVAFGGYVTYPVVQAASKLKVPVILHEQNSVMGLTNKKASKIAETIISCFPKIENYSKPVLFLGNPRESEMDLEKIENIKLFNNDNKIALISGGSQGAMYFNQKIAALYDKINDENLNIIHVTGKNYYQDYKEYERHNIKIVEYVEDFKTMYKNADIFILRAGATTIAEVRNIEKPVILIPSPYVTNDHQTKNAEKLKGTVFSFSEANISMSLVPTLEKISNEPMFVKEMNRKRTLLAKPNALNDIIEQILKLEK
jgi:UDP-N-acetylglucosamine--N-acetylmuramyl-(pentapeptide) pyrophosphoryl-undecaprenol N-acetylglucosamine transferase